jgi:hypothetical protein
MQIRCSQCHRPYAMGREEVIGALETVEEEGLNHYTSYCPHCRRANKISKDELVRAAPERGREEEAGNPDT